MTPVDPQQTSSTSPSPAVDSVGESLRASTSEPSAPEGTEAPLSSEVSLSASQSVSSFASQSASSDVAVMDSSALPEDGGSEAALDSGSVQTAIVVQDPPDAAPELSQKLARFQHLQQKAKATAQASLHRLKHRPTQLFLLGAVATFALGGATSYVLRRPANGPSSLESATALVPDTAVASLTINPKSDPWQALRQLGTPTLQQGLGEWLAVGRDRIVNLGYGDLSVIQQQLAGPPTLALIPFNPATQPLPGQPPQASASDLLLVAPLKNPKAVARSLDEREPPEGFENSASSHRGIKIWDLQVDLVQRQIVAIFGNFGLLASNRSTLERAIDSYQAGTALEDLNEYEDAQRRLGSGDLNSADGALMSFYINGPAAVLSNQAAGRLLPLPAELQGLISQVRITEDDELDLNTVTWDQPADSLGVLAQSAPGLGDKPEAMVALGDRFPASTSFLLSGSSLQEAWRSFSQRPARGNSLLTPTALQEQVKAVTSMDLQQDWLSWMDGPYSVGILPIPTQANSRFQTGLTVMAQTSNRRLAERSLQKLDALMVNKYGLSLSTSQLDGQPVVNWANGNGEAVVTHGWLEGNIAFLIVGAPGANLLLPQPRATLAASRLYREGMPRAASQDPAGVMFVDVDRVLDTQLPSLLPLTPSSRPVLEQLKSIGVERRPLGDRFSRYDLGLKFLSRAGAPPVEAPAVPNASEPLAPEPVAPESASLDELSPETGSSTIEADSPEVISPISPDSDASESIPPQPASQDAEANPQLGPTLPERLPAFGPELLAPESSTDSIDSAEIDRAPNAALDAPTTSESLEAVSAGNNAEAQPFNQNVVIDPRTVVPIGPPTPSRSFDFSPLGPKFPLPEAQQWSSGFTQPAED